MRILYTKRTCVKSEKTKACCKPLNISKGIRRRNVLWVNINWTCSTTIWKYKTFIVDNNNILIGNGGVGSFHSSSKLYWIYQSTVQPRIVPGQAVKQFTSTIAVPFTFARNWNFCTYQSRGTVQMTLERTSWSITTKVTCAVRELNQSCPILCALPIELTGRHLNW
jgi:hypothetical protein